MNANQAKFEVIKKHRLPMHAFAITGSGPLGARDLREIADIDIIVDAELWEDLAVQYGITRADGVEKIVFGSDEIEAFREGSFGSMARDENAPTVAQRIAAAEIIDGLPFESLEHNLYFKRKTARAKDLADVELIEKWLKAFDPRT